MCQLGHPAGANKSPTAACARSSLEACHQGFKCVFCGQSSKCLAFGAGNLPLSFVSRLSEVSKGALLLVIRRQQGRIVPPNPPEGATLSASSCAIEGRNPCIGPYSTVTSERLTKSLDRSFKTLKHYPSKRKLHEFGRGCSNECRPILIHTGCWKSTALLSPTSEPAGDMKPLWVARLRVSRQGCPGNNRAGETCSLKATVKASPYLGAKLQVWNILSV